jgi:hypothetical protein
MRKTMLALSFCAVVSAVIWHAFRASLGSDEATVSSCLSEVESYIDLQASYLEDSRYPDPFEVGLFRAKRDSYGSSEGY